MKNKGSSYGGHFSEHPILYNGMVYGNSWVINAMMAQQMQLLQNQIMN